MGKYGIAIPDILLPNDGIDLTKWCTIACDQYESNPKYWQSVEDLIGDSPSTRYLQFPEVYLDAEDRFERQAHVPEVMKDYIDNVFAPAYHGLIYVERTCSGMKRHGVVLALDLEKYDFAPGSTSLIRATEETIVNRLPPRLLIRKNALVEMPHILVFVDDPKKTLIEPLEECVSDFEKLYDVELMMNGGHLTGYGIDDAATSRMFQALDGLLDGFAQNYGVDPTHPKMLYGIADGNHSLATAKVAWEELKANGAKHDHCARFALVEVENIHDSAIRFEPIHRMLSNTQNTGVEHFLNNIVNYLNDNEEGASLQSQCTGTAKQCIKYFSQVHNGFLEIVNPSKLLEVTSLQAAIDACFMSQPDITVNFLHDAKDIETNQAPNSIGFIVSSMPKAHLFRTVLSEGVFKKKSFSCGMADEKRFYMECRQIV